MTELLQAIVNGLQMGALYALVAVGLAIIWGLMEMVNFAHGEFMMLGMFGAWGLSTALGWDPLLAMVPIGFAIYGLGVLTYTQLMRRVQRGDTFAQIFATVGLLLFLQNSVVAAFTSDYRFVSDTVLTRLSGVGLSVLGVKVGVPLLLAGLLALLLFLALYVLIDRTELGLALQATSEDREAAMLVGIRPQRMFAIAWGLGAALVAIAGVILANFFSVYPQVGLQFTVLAYAIVALGGFGSILGTLIAALLVGVVQSVTVVYLPPAFKDAFVFGSYLLIGLLRPQGLFGRFWAVGRGARVALGMGLLAALIFPLPLQATGYTYYQTVGFLVFLYATLGVGWNFIGGWAGQFDFGPCVFFATGAYTAAVVAVNLGWSPWLALAAGVLVSVAICAIITFPVTRLRGHYFAIATVAMWMIAQPIGATWEYINGSRGFFIPAAPAQSAADALLMMRFAGRTRALAYYYVALGLFVAVMLLARAVDRSKLGYYFRAIRDDQEGAEAIGIDSRVYKTLARCLEAAVFAAGGGVYGFWALAVFPDQVLEMNWSVLPMISTVLGGIGRLWGPLLGAAILIPIAQIMSVTLGAGPLAGRGIDVIVYGLIIMVVAAGRPNGLLSLPWARWFRRAAPPPRAAVRG